MADARPALLASNHIKVNVLRRVPKNLFDLVRGDAMTSNVLGIVFIPIEAQLFRHRINYTCFVCIK